MFLSYVLQPLKGFPPTGYLKPKQHHFPTLSCQPIHYVWMEECAQGSSEISRISYRHKGSNQTSGSIRAFFFFISGMYLSPFLISVNVQFFSLTSLLPCFFWWIFCFYQCDKAICHTVVELTYDKQDKAFEFPHKTLPILTGCVITMCQCLKSLYLCCCSLAGYCPSTADGNQLPMHTQPLLCKINVLAQTSLGYDSCWKTDHQGG